jgi:DNA-binding MarR family transcriptional regulator
MTNRERFGRAGRVEDDGTHRRGNCRGRHRRSLRVLGHELLQHHSAADNSADTILAVSDASDLRALFDDLVRIEIDLWDAVDRRLQRDLDLRLGRAEVLRVIVRTPTCRVQDVAEALRITVGAASKLVDRLEAVWLCVRRAHPDDRRSSLLESTAGGRRTDTAAEAALADELRRRLAGIPAADLSALTALLASTRGVIATTA